MSSPFPARTRSEPPAYRIMRDCDTALAGLAHNDSVLPPRSATIAVSSSVLGAAGGAAAAASSTSGAAPSAPLESSLSLSPTMAATRAGDRQRPKPAAARFDCRAFDILTRHA
eukprot:550849-Prymnesium_polylepis.1